MSDTKRNCSICKYGYMNNGSGEICPKNDCVDYSLFEPAIPDKPAQPEAVKPDDAYCGNCEYYRLGDIAEECKTCTVLSMNDRSKHHSNWKPKPEPSALANGKWDNKTINEFLSKLENKVVTEKNSVLGIKKFFDDEYICWDIVKKVAEEMVEEQ